MGAVQLPYRNCHYHMIQYLKQLAKESGALSDCCKWGICTRTICNVFYIVFVKILSQLYTATPKRAEDLS
ncbi:hypothetical protein GQ600_9973 [Phytophthora cactorum]|nr:hypothetical protein GQ600_9973 [Phytophthora cactorum]